MKRVISLCWLLVVVLSFTYAQEDMEGGTDVPYFTRMPNHIITHTANRDFDAYQMYDGKTLVTIEGKVYQTAYELKEDVKNPPSELQIRRNLIAAIKNLGGKILFEGEYEFDDTRANNTLATGKVVKDGRELWIEAWPYPNGYTLTVVEREAMEQEITANDILSELNKSGFIALYINFETGKSAIMPESQNLIDQIAAMLKSNPSLNVSIEGHTDNVGSPASNKSLSENRATSVMNAIVGKGVEKSRLSTKGWGQENPVGDNRTEEGRAKNRRVEIVKK
ncbi:MAG: OmpA family protein [Ignavibacteriae bacterium]|nr:OmpA family protein [Ignavibacteriota bacterium]